MIRCAVQGSFFGFFCGPLCLPTWRIWDESGWSPKAGAWQRQLNDNTFWVVDRISFLRPLSGEKPSELQAKARKVQQEKPSIRAQLKAAKEGQQQKPPAKEKSQDLEV